MYENNAAGPGVHNIVQKNVSNDVQQQHCGLNVEFAMVCADVEKVEVKGMSVRKAYDLELFAKRL